MAGEASAGTCKQRRWRGLRAGSIALFLGVATGATWSAGAVVVNLQEQSEADDRVIAARCGTPAFEKIFFRNSQAAVRAGAVARGKRPEDSEKAITQLRRSPLVLVSSNADCPSQLDRLKAVMRARPSAAASRKAARGKPAS